MHNEWTTDSVRALLRFLDTVRFEQELWKRGVETVLIGSFSLWSRTPFVVQANLLLSINPQQLREFNGVAPFIGMLIQMRG